MVRIKVTVKQDTVTPKIKAMKNRIGHLQQLLVGPILQDIRATFAAIWANAGAFAGMGPWPMLAESTLKRKPGRSAEILVASGDLREGFITPFAGSRGYGHTTQEGGFVYLEVGSNMEYADFHQTGTSRMPKRQIVPDQWPQEDIDRWAQLGADFIVEGRLG